MDNCPICGKPAPKQGIELYGACPACFRTQVRAQAVEELVKAAREALPDNRPSEWWCPRCFRWVPGTEVNHDETHDVCGAPVGAPEDDPKVAALRAALARLDAVKANG